MDDDRRRFGSAHVLALLALFASLVTVAYAAQQAAKNSVTSRSVRNGSLTGTDVKNNSLTGTDVKESTLGLVPSALTAQSAQTAGSTQSFDGLKKIDYRDNQTGTQQTILSFRGMDLKATCEGISGPATAILLDLHTTPAATANASMMRAFQPSGSDPNERTGEGNEPDLIVRGGALSGGGSMAVIPAPNPGAPDAMVDGNLSNTFTQAEGQLVYRSNSDVVTINFHTFVDHAGSTSGGYCEILGNAVAQ